MGKVAFWSLNGRNDAGVYMRDVQDLSPWNVVKIAGTPLPGRAAVRGSLGNKVDRKKVPGQDGDTMTHLGYEPAKVEVTLVLWSEDQLRAFEKIVPILRPRKLPGNQEPKPVTVYHPALEIYGIRALFLMELGLPEPGQAAGTYEVKIQFAEYFKEVEKNNVTKGATVAKGAPKSDPGGALSAKPASQGVNPPSRAGMVPIGATPQ